MQKTQQSTSEKKDYVIYAAYGILDNKQRGTNEAGENKRFTDDGNLFIDENRTLSTTVFRQNENGDIDTIPYVGNPGKEEYPCILYEIDEDDISILGYTNGDANTAFDKSNFIDFFSLQEVELIYIGKDPYYYILSHTDNKYVLQKIKDKNPNNPYANGYAGDEQDKKVVADVKKEILYDEYHIEDHEGFIVFKYYDKPNGAYIGRIVSNLSNEEVIKFYKKENDNFRKTVEEILKVGINNIYDKNKPIYEEYKEYGYVNIRNIGDDYRISKDGHHAYIKDNKLIHYFYNEFVLEPKNKDRIVKSKGITLCFFHNEKQKAASDSRESVDFWGYQRFTTKEICETISNNLDKIKQFQQAKGLNTINIIEEDGKKHQIKLSDIEQYIQNKKNGISCDNLWIIKNENIAKKNIMQNNKNKIVKFSKKQSNENRSNDTSGIMIIKKNIDDQDNDEVEDVRNRIAEKQKTRPHGQKDEKQNNIFGESGILNNASNNGNTLQTQDLPWWKKIMNFFSCENSCKTCLDQERNVNEMQHDS